MKNIKTTMVLAFLLGLATLFSTHVHEGKVAEYQPPGGIAISSTTSM